MTLQIRSIILYNVYGETRQLQFQLGGVNYIAGGSDTGKSAIIPIIEYCLGSSEFNVPGDVIRNTVARYAVVYRIGNNDILVAKSPPSTNNSKQYQAFYQVNPEVIPPPLDVLVPNSNDAEVRLQIGRLLDAEAGRERSSGVRLDLTLLLDTYYYLFQKSSVIASDTILFHRQELSADRVKTSLLHFLDIVQQSDIELDLRLDEARRRRRLLRDKVNEERRVQNDLLTRGRNLINEAETLGLVPPQTDIPSVEDINRLKQILSTAASSWQPTVTPNLGEDPRLSELGRELNLLKQELARINVTLDSALDLQREMAGYTGQAEDQRQRLRAIDIFAPQDPFEFAEILSRCPLCQAELSDDHLHIPQISAIRRSLEKLENDLRIVEMDRSDVGQRIENLRTQHKQKQREVERKQLDIAEILNQTKATDSIVQEIVVNNSRVDRLIGRMQYFLEMSAADPLDDLVLQLQEAEQDFVLLESSKASSDTESRKRRVLSNLSEQMTQWAGGLAIARQGRYLLDIDRLTVLVDDYTRTYTMSEIGGGANIVKCHLVALLALHKYFIEHRQSVPGFIILDQPAQGFFPTRADYEASQDKSTSPSQARQSEIGSARAMFDFLFRVVDELNGDLQIIILEHAYFEQPEFEQALVNGETWFHEIGLIPKEWADRVTQLPRQQPLL